MINLLLDEGYAFDYISILAIKNEKFKNQALYLMQCCEQIKQQIGENLFLSILDSDEYKNLKEANKKTFDAVDKARYGKITAKKVDACNMERYNAKVALQKKFFNSTSTEYKN
jgi:hypothetical protein